MRKPAGWWVTVAVFLAIVIPSILVLIFVPKVKDPWEDRTQIVVYAPDVPNEKLLAVIFSLARLEASIKKLPHSRESADVKMRYDELEQFLTRLPAVEISEIGEE